MAMWPFFSNANKDDREQTAPMTGGPGPQPEAAPASARRPMRFGQLIEGMGNFDHFDTHDRALKFWLPEPAREALEDLAKRQAQSMSELLRQFLFQHCYGVYAHALLMDKRKQDDALLSYSRDLDDIRFSRKASYEPKKDPTYWVPELGKNVTSLKIWTSNQMYSDLEALAQHSRITVSQYVREIVISRLLGHGTLPKRPEMLEAVPRPAAEQWEAGDEVEMRQVTEDEYTHHDDGRIERD